MLASNINHGNIDTMGQSFNETSNTKKSSYLDSTDSEDEDQPPALSDYALALLQKDKESEQSEFKFQHHVPKRVNFNRQSSIINGSQGSNFTNNNNINNHTSHTNQSEHETIFTKNVNNDLQSMASSSPNEKHQKTPLHHIGSSNNNSFGSDHSNIRLRSSIRRNRTLGSLGPPKRIVKIEEPDEENKENQNDQRDDQLNKEDFPKKQIIDPVVTPRARKISPYTTNSFQSTPQKTPFDFEGLNPYQYSKKYNLPSNELPKLVKLYFEQQRNQTKQTLAQNSPARLREALYTKIEDDINQKSPYRPEPRQKLFKADTDLRSSSSFKNHKNIDYRSKDTKNDFKAGQGRVQVFEDKENIDIRPKNILNSIERPSKVARKPLLPLSDLNQNIKQEERISSQNTLKANIEKTVKPVYQEHHVQQVEPLKAPDLSYQRSSSRIMSINGKQYEKLDLLGKGGSSKVFKVKSTNNKVYAVKKISFDEFDDSSIKGFKGEIDLLTKLRDKERVVRLIDHSLGQGSLVLVMECGDLDLSYVLTKRLELPLDIEFVRFHANEVLKCVKAVHDAGIVHSDLKPANFLFVKGMLKIIDFGIANAVPDHTMNIYRENQIGTPNYMAPEALIDNNQQLAETTSHHKSTWKVGKPSDIWSCGCIIYQMIYGRAPYGGYQGTQRLLAIMNPDVKISYPEKGLGGVKVPGTAIETIKACLLRDPNERWTAQDVLDGPFLKPRVVSEQFINDLVKNAITYGVGKSSIGDDELRTLADDVWRRVSQLSL
ncbi:Serine/threonine-protein kinase [Wickerhamomyces ciferrii]|uniref:Serine/threonine-protein kinase n=1 Tax=Wickerhamomyces ciferrii (strain ATCC 14091 / BCRC 22168 / CBS 111 / JCM 3599 / NBRC 0793 / NRRL Y-1031 F-60-10) TaxID=1206466 RepID=K0KIZ9_WICCF|nr:Serine/threonine-protein kinase [Wickerhamomyces ciferrii]CCH45200.1 Serine/threonine-protein kinase [Wickerhamomyces ciferrii]